MFRDKTALITGASSGLGASLAATFAASGANLALFALDDAGLEETAERCREHGVQVVTAAGDVGRPEDCQRVVEQAVAQFGTLDYLIACAGISMWARFDEVADVSLFRRLMETNYLGIVHCVYYALPHLKKVGGMIVAISSIQGKIGVPLHTGYVASKHAVQGFFASLRMELGGSGVHVLTVLPHWLRGTNLRKEALGRDGSALGASRKKHSKESVSLEECGEAIVEAIQKRKRELVIPGKLKFLPWLDLVNPKIVERLVSGAVREQDK